MKKHLFSVLMCAAALLAGCNSQDIEEGADGSGTHFINVTIAMGGSSTRADDPTFQEGTGDESDISSVIFVFYNEAGNVIASSDLSSVTKKTTDLETGVEYNFQVQLTLPVGAQLPKSVMAFANPQNASQVKTLPISQISTQTRTDYKNSAGDFTMTNAVYFESSSPYKQIREVSTPESYYYTSDADASSATPVVIYLERVAAKVTVSEGSDLSSNNEVITLEDLSSTEHKMHFVIDKWGLTGLEKSTYALKYFNPSIYNNAFLADALGASAAEKVFTGWNDPANHRSYWANSVTYGESDYPSVSDELLGTSVTDKFFESNTTSANNYDDNDTHLNYPALKDMTYTIGNSAYLLENTVRSAVASAMASVIICGHYEDESNTAISTFYVIGDKFFTEDGLKEYMLSLNQLYLKKGDNPVSASDKGDFVIVHPTVGLNTSGGDPTKNAENIVTINLKSSSVSNYKYKTTDAEGAVTWAQVTTGNLPTVNQSIYQNAQVAEAFNGGKAYFVWPIKHLNNDMEHGVGQYGVVRNHVYDITVQSITGLGNGVFNPDIPVVPNDETTNYGINVNVNVLKWRLVTQNANLKR